MKANDFLRFGLTAVIGIFATPHVVAAPVAFTIDPARTTVTLSGYVSIPGVGNYAFQPQAGGSLSTTCTGTILADISPPSISFPGGSLVSTANNGNWQPAPGGVTGSATADFGGKITPPLTTGYFAARNILLDITGSPVALTNGSFDAGRLVINYLTNSIPPATLDYRVTSFIAANNTNGTSQVSGFATNTTALARLTNGAGLLTLVIPVNATNYEMLGSDPVIIVQTGTVVATAPASAWPLLVSITSQAGQISLTWPSLPGQKFAVQNKTSLASGWLPAAGFFTTNATTTTWTTSISNAASYFRVVASY